MSDSPELKAYFDAVMALLKLAPEAGWRTAALANLAVIAAMAESLEAFPLDDELEPAPVYEP